MDLEKLFDLYLKDFSHDFQGWDFSYIQDRMVEFPTSWSYHSRIIPYVLKANSLLDMGTGGGEFLSRLPFPKKTYATESYPPNITVAKARLEPLGINVIPLKNPKEIPIKDNTCDLVINRHEFYVPSEVYRILHSGGTFITQQVGNENDIEINQLLDAPKPKDYDPKWTVDFLANELHEIGFEIQEKNSEICPSRIFDIGALVYYLKIVPWQIPDFSIEKYRNKLFEIHQMIQEKGYIEIKNQRYFIIARK